MVRVRFGWATEDGRVGEAEVDGGDALPTLSVIANALSNETRIPAAEVEILLNGNVLKAEEVGKLSSGEMVLVRRKAVAAGSSSTTSSSSSPASHAANAPLGGAMPTQPTPEQIRDHVRNNPALLTQLLHQNPVMAEAILSDDISVLTNLLQQQAQERRRRELEEERRVAALNANPFDADAQRQIEEQIRQENVLNNYESALEHNPEAFGRVVMLYIDCTVNGHPLKAFVDSGAQSTIMSAACAQRCGLMRLLDTRFAGVAKGVGTAKILGRVHVAPLTIGKEVFTSSFTVLEGTDMDFLLGLDMLRKHQACINLRESVLEIGSQKVPFLAEKDIPLHLRHEDKGDPPSPTPLPSPAAATVPPQPKISLPLAPPASNPVAKTSPPIAQQQQQSFPADVIQKLMDLGYTREQVIQALTRYNGNAEMAAASLFDGMGF